MIACTCSPTNGGEVADASLLALLLGFAAADDAGADPVGQHGHGGHARPRAGLRADRAGHR
ncbi:MAG: hypothetical protein MZV49_26425 [Rhodopseudomonas palustris]|nr:hypothetical protein [Rhodopseudomonas palustris]